MKKVYIILLISIITINLNAQVKKQNKTKQFQIDSTCVLTIDSTIKTLYSVISGEKGVERNWEQFKYLFHSNANLIPSGKTNEGTVMARFLKPTDYIKSSGKWLVENGFFEKEIHRKVDLFGNIAHVLSTYEAFYSETDKEPFMRGINSIQLFNDGKRWWIINIFWSQETKENPIPKKYQRS